MKTIKPYYKNKDTTIFKAKAEVVLAQLPAGSIDCVITSPPYWNLRDYNIKGQLGLERSPAEYIEKLAAIFNQIWRVLAPTGSVWVNIGDTYNSGHAGPRDSIRWPKQASNNHRPNKRIITKSIRKKSLCQIPARFSIAMTNRGWILRNEII